MVVLGTGGSYAVSTYVIDKVFTASVSMYVVPSNDDPDIYASLNELDYAQKIVNTYIVILRTNDFLDNVARTSGLGYSSDELKSMVTINQVNNTEIFEIHVTSRVPEDSFLLANTIASLAPQKIIEIKNADAVRAVDPATLPLRPSAPNIQLNTAFGFVFGLVLGVMTAFLLGIVDKRIKDEEDLSHYNIPVLGTIPMIEEK
jgi:capsular polysaccharide biosynthesis protein